MNEAIKMKERAGLTTNEAAEILGVSLPMVYNLLHTEGFPAFRIGKRWVISKQRLFDWVDRQADEKSIIN